MTAASDREIGRLRQGTIRVKTRPGATVKVTQQRHGFQFGSPIGGTWLRLAADDPERLRMEQFLTRWFNGSVIGVKWGAIEPAEGDRRYATADAVLDWSLAHGFGVRGHCIFYAHRIHVQEWVRNIADDATVLRHIERHARDIARRYRGRIPEYDLNNELLDGCWYRSRLGDDILRRMADWVLEEDPDATLYVNEHDIVTGGDIDRYVELIDRLLELGVPIGGIGCQGHLDPPFDLSHIKPVLDRLGQFGLPIKITESDTGIKLKEERYQGVPWIEGADKEKDLERFRRIVDGYPPDFEERKAAAIDGLYRIAFAHPAVAAIFMWGFQEGHQWRTRGEIVRRDVSLLPGGRAYENLVRGEWWTDTATTAGDDGFCAIRAYYGTHRVEADGAVVELDLTPDNEKQIVRLAANS